MVQKKQKRILSSILIMSMMVGGCSLLTQFQSDQNTETQELTFAAVKGTINSSIDIIGNVEYNQSASLSWKTDGVISQVNVKLGDTVKKGDILAVLETDSLNSSVILAEKTLIEAQEALTDVMESTTAKMTTFSTLTVNEISLKSTKQAQEALYYPRADQLTIDMAYDEYMLTVEKFNYAKADYDSVKDQKGWEDAARQTYYESYKSTYDSMIEAYENWIWTKGEPTDTELAVAQGAVQVAQQAYDEALAEYQTYETLPRQKDVQEAEINLTNAENSYNKRNIIATFDGTVTAVDAEVGHYVTSDTAAFQIDDMSRIFIPVDISEIDIQKVFSGQKVTVSLDAVTDKTYSGTVNKISDLGEGSNSRVTFETMVELTDPDESVKAGMTAEAEIVLEENENVLLVPLNAINTISGKTYVTISSDDGNRQIEVGVGMTTDLLAEITSGVTEGDLIVVPSIDTQLYTELGIQPAGMEQFGSFPGISGTAGGFALSGSGTPVAPGSQQEMVSTNVSGGSAGISISDEATSFDGTQSPQNGRGTMIAPPDGAPINRVSMSTSTPTSVSK
ncbi:MAG: efflux RND transporter periplasmic adaptor subunit [Flexilinea sp.]